MSSSAVITMSKTGDIRITRVKGIEYVGGIASGNSVIVSSGSRVTLQYKDSATGERSTIIIQYRRT